MNQDQIASYIRSALKIGGALLAAHGYTQAAGAASDLLNCSFIIGLLASGAGVLLSHFWHSSPPTNLPPPKATGTALLLALALMLPSAVLFTGCHTTPQQATYQAAGTASVTVETALKAYDVFAAQGKTTPAQNAAVKAAYEKYQAAFAFVCDAGAIYASTGQTNTPAASAAVQTAIVNANQTIADLLALVRSCGVKI